MKAARETLGLNLNSVFKFKKIKPNLVQADVTSEKAYEHPFLSSPVIDFRCFSVTSWDSSPLA